MTAKETAFLPLPASLAPPASLPALERTLLIVKPDGVARGLVGRILQRFEDKGLRFVALRLARVSEATAREHYAEHKEKPFYPALVDFLTSGPVVLAVAEGAGAVAVCRKLMGKTFGPEAEPGTIRGDFGLSRSTNLIHGSDSPASAEREIALYFRDDDFVGYDAARLAWHYSFENGRPE